LKEKRLMPELIEDYDQERGKDVSIGVDHIYPHRSFRTILRDPTPEEIAYFQTNYSEHHFYYDVNDRELLVFLMVPEKAGQFKDLDEFLRIRDERVIIQGFSLGLVWKHLFNYADLAQEDDYDQNKWRNPFRCPTRWNWMLEI